ncbi:MAG: hypothetical protein SPI52_05740 [Bacilli bacterium]|nr:hypothetical protein [Bacilli bacterium]
MKKIYIIMSLISLLPMFSCANKEKEPIKTQEEIFLEKYHEKYPNGYTFCDGNYFIETISNAKRNSQDMFNEYSRIKGDLSFLPSHYDLEAYSSSFSYVDNIYEVKTSNKNSYRVENNIGYYSNTKSYYVDGVKQIDETSTKGEVSKSRIKIHVDDDIIRINNFSCELIKESGYDCTSVYHGNNSITFSVYPPSNSNEYYGEYSFTYCFDENMELKAIYTFVVENFLFDNEMEMHEKTLSIMIKEKYDVTVDFSIPENLSSFYDFTKEITI